MFQLLTLQLCLTNNLFLDNNPAYVKLCVANGDFTVVLVKYTGKYYLFEGKYTEILRTGFHRKSCYISSKYQSIRQNRSLTLHIWLPFQHFNYSYVPKIFMFPNRFAQSAFANTFMHNARTYQLHTYTCLCRTRVQSRNGVFTMSYINNVGLTLTGRGNKILRKQETLSIGFTIKVARPLQTIDRILYHR